MSVGKSAILLPVASYNHQASEAHRQEENASVAHSSLKSSVAAAVDSNKSLNERTVVQRLSIAWEGIKSFFSQLWDRLTGRSGRSAPQQAPEPSTFTTTNAQHLGLPATHDFGDVGDVEVGDDAGQEDGQAEVIAPEVVVQAPKDKVPTIEVLSKLEGLREPRPLDRLKDKGISDSKYADGGAVPVNSLSSSLVQHASEAADDASIASEQENSNENEAEPSSVIFHDEADPATLMIDARGQEDDWDLIEDKDSHSHAPATSIPGLGIAHDDKGNGYLNFKITGMSDKDTSPQVLLGGLGMAINNKLEKLGHLDLLEPKGHLDLLEPKRDVKIEILTAESQCKVTLTKGAIETLTGSGLIACPVEVIFSVSNGRISVNVAAKKHGIGVLANGVNTLIKSNNVKKILEPKFIALIQDAFQCIQPAKQKKVS